VVLSLPHQVFASSISFAEAWVMAASRSFSPLFTPGMPDEAKAMAQKKLGERLAWVDGQLAGKDYLMGDTFTVADAYLFTVAGWGKYVGVDISGLQNLSAYMGRVAARPAVQEALKAEGLLK
jgi:glutathione S-transferase